MPDQNDADSVCYNLFAHYSVYRVNVGSWLVCGPPSPPSLNYIWTLFKVENQKFSSQKKNIPSIK